MTQYLLSVHMVEGEPVPSDEEMQGAYKSVEEVNAEMRDKGVWVFAGGLHPADTAAVVRTEDGEVRTADGPFSGNKEQLGGFWVLDVADRDAALEWAGKATAACLAPVEVRAFQEDC